MLGLPTIYFSLIEMLWLSVGSDPGYRGWPSKVFRLGSNSFSRSGTDTRKSRRAKHRLINWGIINRWSFSGAADNLPPNASAIMKLADSRKVKLLSRLNQFYTREDGCLLLIDLI
ncbi:hypothetical protein WN55_00113 [Dufourea novaeangliae]|uniref:Uncharacterized protein n=1 Tax=Dufourea novaeangliae TaxID=178035 RepID=A0A154NWG5_DUFNO|nr:hypothetical protein WN55_00113 [Dufourea novaeangliae]